MINKIFILFLCFFTIVSCKNLNYKIEDDLMECLEESFPDKGREFKGIFSNYEKDLIDAKILKSSSGKSYKNLLEEIKGGNKLDYDWPEPFLERFMKSGELVTSNIRKLRTCQEKITKNEKIDSIENIILDLKRNKSSIIAKRILSNLSKNDFEKDFYKFNILMTIDIIKPSKDESPFREEIPSNAESLDIYLNANNKIYVEGKIVKPEQVNQIISKYLDDINTSNGIKFYSRKNVMYKNYIALQNDLIKAFLSSRNKFSINKYDDTYDNLDIQKQKIIDQTYPKDFIE